MPSLTRWKIILVPILLLASALTPRVALSASSGPENRLVDEVSLDQGDMHLLEVPGGVKLAADAELKGHDAGYNYTFPDGADTAPAAVLFNYSNRAELECPGHVCRSAPNNLDYCRVAIKGPYTCAPAGESCESSFGNLKPPSPCYDVVRAWFEDVGASQQDGGGVSINYHPSYWSGMIPLFSSPQLDIRVSDLPAGRIRLALFLGSPSHDPSDNSTHRQGCFHLTYGGTTTQAFASLAYNARGLGQGELIEWELGGATSADIQELQLACGVPGLQDSDVYANVPVSGVFILPAPAPPKKPSVKLWHSQVHAGGALKGMVYTAPGARVSETLLTVQGTQQTLITTIDGKAGPKGRFPINITITPHPARATKARLLVGIRTPGGSAETSVYFTILP